MNFVSKIKSSAAEFHNVKSLIGCGMLSALKIIVGMFSIQLIPNMLILGFSSHILAVIGMNYGVVMGGIAAVIIDHLEFLIKGGSEGPYFFGFALNAMIGVIIYGIFFYQKKEITIKNVILSRLIVTIIVNLILTPIWLNMLYGSQLLAWPRIIKTIIEFPFDCIIMYYVLKAALRIKN